MLDVTFTVAVTGISIHLVIYGYKIRLHVIRHS